MTATVLLRKSRAGPWRLIASLGTHRHMTSALRDCICHVVNIHALSTLAVAGILANKKIISHFYVLFRLLPQPPLSHRHAALLYSRRLQGSNVAAHPTHRPRRRRQHTQMTRHRRTMVLARDEDSLNCGSGGGDSDDFNLRIISIFVILVGSMFGSLFPVVSRRVRWLSSRIPKGVFDFAKYFGSGVIVCRARPSPVMHSLIPSKIATAFIHLLDPAIDELSSPCLAPGWSEYVRPTLTRHTRFPYVPFSRSPLNMSYSVFSRTHSQ